MCRRRKLRCDRTHPCGACSQRGLSLSCTYPPSAGETGRITKEQQPSAKSTLPERIGQLEKLITAIVDDAGNQKTKTSIRIQRQDPPSGNEAKATSQAEAEAASDPSDSFGHISLQDSKTTYVQDTHWTAILDGITELKDSVQHEVAANSSQPFVIHNSSDMLFPNCEPTTHAEILEQLPSRETCDRLVADYFNYSSLPLLHGPSFLREYDRFWADHTSTHLMWIGKLYGVMSLALMFQSEGESLKNRNELIAQFDKKVNQCLVLGRYQDCPPNTIETICFTLSTQFNRMGNGEVNSVIILGILARMAQRMGYHRDASHFPHITPFQGEMRRRVWAMITNLDVMLSMSVGLPRLLREFQSDTAPPRNLLDSDFDEDTTELPPSRPNSYSTPCQWLVAKNKLTLILGIITDFSTSIRRPSYAEVMRLDQLLLDTYLDNPEYLLERPLSQSLMDTSETILHRIQLIILFAKARCVLHYRYLASSRTDERYSYSRSTCIGAALKILEYQRLMNEETQPGGRLFRERWKVRSPIMRGVILLGTTLLCLELNYDLSHNPTNNPKSRPLTELVRAAIVQALRTSHSIWSEAGDSYPKSTSTIQAIDLVFQKLQDQQNSPSPGTVPNSADFFNVEPVAGSPIDPFAGANLNIWPELGGAMFLDHANNFPQLQPNYLNPPVPSSHVAPELLDLTNSVDEMLGISLNYPR
ncbi:hypothetical protein N7451_010079 [Penicillium sp. IBT 35674x]|nr:hypothetical protein N7451_010079 [Penicillium sp. IBT 35674x]